MAFDASVAFYTRLLDCSPSQLASGYAEFTIPGLRLAIFRPRAGDEPEFKNAGRGSGLNLCFDVTDLAATLQLFASEPAQHSEILSASHGRECYLYDPDGNRVILFEPADSVRGDGDER